MREAAICSLEQNSFYFDGCPTPTLKRPIFEIEFLISLYRVVKGEWKMREETLLRESSQE